MGQAFPPSDGIAPEMSSNPALPERRAWRRPPPLGSHSPGRAWTRTLGVASVGLGVPAVAVPGAICRTVGLVDDAGARAIVRVVGVRELAAAAGLLFRPRRLFLWARVAGDALDLGLLGWALAGHRREGLGRTLATTAAIAGITGVDLVAAVTTRQVGGPLEVRASVSVRRPRTEVYQFWRELQNLPSFMVHLDRVEPVDERRSHWVATAPFGREIEWDAEVVGEVRGERLQWKSIEGADVMNEGTVRFVDAPGDEGTEVHVELRYHLPAGKLGRAVARYYGEEPRQQLDDDLRRLKQLLETGEVVRSDGAPWGVRARHQFPQRPARPLRREELAEGATS